MAQRLSALLHYLLALSGLLLHANAQIRVMSPDNLIAKLGNGGRIEGSTATFGAPFYGDRVLGRLVYGQSKGNAHCTEDDYEIPDAAKMPGSQSPESARLINIVLVRRGKCSFTRKVSLAYEKGAHAVLIVDKEDSTLQTKDMSNIIVADDGRGNKIHIPSVLIAKAEGNKLIEEAGRANSKVIVELAWDLPTSHHVVVDLWMSSASMESLNFLKEFAPKRRTLNQVVIFKPHYAVFGVDSKSPDLYNGLCTDETGKYCAEDPDGSGPITGKMVLIEDVRQICIHEIYKATQVSRQPGVPPVEYAREYWDYIEQFMDACPLTAENEQDRFGEACSDRLMAKVGIDTAKIHDCQLRHSDEYLKSQRENPAWSPRALRINGWRYSGILDSDLVTRAICSGFITQPQECKDLIKPRNPFIPYTEQNYDGVSFSTMIGWLLGTAMLSFAALLLYKRYLKKEMRTTLREEVMLEVQAQMGEYSKLQA
mmetsp:Transcript_14381/g.36764  ORF Transcript_14381/g.36764 Transcript_14381/m.36764 type:complete len:482 (+) Transcript_14381:71-1516(+)